MNERSSVVIRRELRFEKSGEAFSVEISMENASGISKKSAAGFFDELYAKVKEEFLADSSS